MTFAFRYRIQLNVEDHTGLGVFILFDHQVEKLIHISTKDLLNKCIQVRSL
jgi:hypothetical protein